MTARAPYQYVVLRCVPRTDREEFLNVGVVLYCEEAGFLGASCHLDETRLSGFAPELDLVTLERTVENIAAVCRGDASAGEVAERPLGVRFGYLKAPRSTVVQPGPVHGGVTGDPVAELTALMGRFVR